MPTAPVATRQTMTATDLTPPPDRLRRAALFLDMDGVLAPIVPRPEMVGPEPKRTALLRALADRLGGRVAVVSGRMIADIDRIVEGAIEPVAGIHGLERRTAEGEVERVGASRDTAAAVAEARDWAEDRDGVTIEDKGVALALHYRLAPDQGRAVAGLAEALARDHGLVRQPGQMVEELKTPGSDKGRALTAFMAEAPFHGAMPIMVGDDLTDEHAFEAANALGGFGVLVGPPRPTAARHRLDSVAETAAWLARIEEIA